MTHIIIKYIILMMVFAAVWLITINVIGRMNKNIIGSLVVKTKNRYRKDIEMLQEQSSRRWEWHRIKRVGKLSGILGVVLGFALNDFDFLSLQTYLIGILMMFAGFYVPGIVLLIMKKQRIKNLEKQLPEALAMIVGSMKAGLSLSQALEIVATEAPQPFAEEIKMVVRDCRLGLTAEEGLEKMLLRWPNADFELFVTAASVSIRTGGNLAEVTARIIETVRERFRLRDRIDTLTAQGKLSGWVVGLLPVFLLMALSYIEPDMMKAFFLNPAGWVMLGAGLVLEIAGAFFINKIASIKA